MVLLAEAPAKPANPIGIGLEAWELVRADKPGYDVVRRSDDCGNKG